MGYYEFNRINKKISSRKLLDLFNRGFKYYIEKQFTKNMNWENYGKWHIDHIKPISKFDLTDQEEQKMFSFHKSSTFMG